MEIKEFILNDADFEKIKNRNTRKKRIVPADYNILFQSGCDFGIEKKRGKMVSRLIVLVSKGQYYITEGKSVRVLNVPLLKKFLKELDGNISLPEVYWLSGLSNDQNMPGRILKVVRSENFTDLLKKGTTYVYSDQELECRQHDGEEFIGYQHMYDTLGVIRDEYQNFYNWTVDFLASRRNVTKKNLFRDLIGMENGRKETMLLQSFDAFQQIYEMYGAEWGKAAVEKYMSSAIEDTINNNYISSLFNVFSPQSSPFRNIEDDDDDDWIDFDTDFASFERAIEHNRKNIVKRLPANKTLEYMLQHSLREGYAFSMNEFLKDWIQYLQKQKEIYGKIEDKYPAHLKSSLKRLEYEYRLHEKEIALKQWGLAVEKMKELEFKDDVYMIKSPTSKEDLDHEASQQHNCVLGYAEKVKRGEEQIVFLRKCDEEDKSLVTLEVLPGGRVGQVFRAFNNSPSKEEMKFIRKWAKAKGLIMPENPLPPRAAGNTMDEGFGDTFGGVFGGPFGGRMNQMAF